MKKEILKNDEAYRIGDKVLSAIRMPDEEIEEIVNASHLFDRIWVEMKARPFALEIKDSSFRWFACFGLKRQAGLAMLGLLLVVVAGAAGLIVFWVPRNSSDVVLDFHRQLVPSLEIARSAPVHPDSPASRVSDAEPVSLARRRSRENKPAMKLHSVKRPARLESKEEMGEFQTVTYTDDTDEAATGGRIVRVDLPRASLYAMGIDLPVDSGTGKIKTDLLIGFDGVMKAIRIVKMD